MDKKLEVVGENTHNLENGRQRGDRVLIKKDKREEYLRDVEVPEEMIRKWREAKAEVEKEGKDFVETHPKALVVAAPQLFIQDKMPGKYKVGPLLDSKMFVWVKSEDVDDYPLTT